MKSAPKNSSVLKEYLKRHYLAGLLVKEVVRSLSSNHKDIRMKSLKLLKDVLTKIDFDERYQEPEVKKRTFGIFFPFIIAVRSILTCS